MSYEDSPSLDEYQSGIPARQPEPGDRQKRVRVLLAIFAGMSVLIWIGVLLQTNASAVLSGKGSVSGTVIDNFNRPLEAEVILLGGDRETTSDTSGHFVLDGIPAGEQTIVVARNGTGLPYRVTVPRGGRVEIGELILVTTPEPGS